MIAGFRGVGCHFFVIVGFCLSWVITVPATAQSEFRSFITRGPVPGPIDLTDDELSDIGVKMFNFAHEIKENPSARVKELARTDLFALIAGLLSGNPLAHALSFLQMQYPSVSQQQIDVLSEASATPIGMSAYGFVYMIHEALKARSNASGFFKHHIYPDMSPDERRSLSSGRLLTYSETIFTYQSIFLMNRDNQLRSLSSQQRRSLVDLSVLADLIDRHSVPATLMDAMDPERNPLQSLQGGIEGIYRRSRSDVHVHDLLFRMMGHTRPRDVAWLLYIYNCFESSTAERAADRWLAYYLAPGVLYVFGFRDIADAYLRVQHLTEAHTDFPTPLEEFSMRPR